MQRLKARARTAGTGGTRGSSNVKLLDRGIVRLDFPVEAHRDDVARLMWTYADQPMSVAEGCLVRMAEVADASQVVTTDRDFRVYRRRGRHAIPLLAPFA